MNHLSLYENIKTDTKRGKFSFNPMPDTAVVSFPLLHWGMRA